MLKVVIIMKLNFLKKFSDSTCMSWLTQGRMTLYSWALVIVFWHQYWLYLLGLIYSSGNFGGDFLAYYSASYCTQSDCIVDAYDLQKFHDIQAKITDNMIGETIFLWLYPPVFFLFIFPLSIFHYNLSFAIWIIATISGYIYILKKSLPDMPFFLKMGLIIGFPGTLINVIFGQNGFLSTLFLGGGLLLIERHPFMGGFLLGMLFYKPHLIILVFFALYAANLRSALKGMILSAISLTTLSIVCFGIKPWAAFIGSMPNLRIWLADPRFPLHYMSSVWSGAMLLGVPNDGAIGIQLIVSTMSFIIIIWAWKQKIEMPMKMAIVTVCIFLFSPYSFIYDLCIMAISMAWYGYDVSRKGWLSFEKSSLLFLWFVPLYGLFPKLQNFPLIILSLIGYVCLIIRRIKVQKAL